SSIDDKMVKGIDGLYENTNPNSNVKYVVDEAKFGGGRLGMTKDGKQMSNDWLMGSWTGNNRILDAVDGDFRLSNRSEEHTSELQSRFDLVCRLLLEKKKKNK